MDRTSVKKLAYEYSPAEIDLLERAVKSCIAKHGANRTLNIDFNFIRHASRDVRDMHRMD
jgi:hypothetical protein